MIKYVLAICVILKSLLGEGQTFAKKIGDVVGNQTVISVPIYSGSPTKQALIYYPDGYFDVKNKDKTYPVLFFGHGSGEAGTDISLVNKQAIPYLISQGLKPYNIDPITKDTVKWIVISTQCSEPGGNCSYSFPQLQYTIPYCLKNYRINPNCVWFAGLSMGGSATFSLGMADTAWTMKYMTGLMPTSNGGWDDNFAKYGPNLAYCMRQGLSVLYVIGEMDPGNNPQGYGQYSKLMRANALPGHYADSIIKGGTHSANVWNTPYPLTSRLWSKTQNSWDLMWSLRKNANVVTPPPVIVTPPPTPVDTTKKIPYPVRIIVKMSDSSCNVIYTRP